MELRYASKQLERRCTRQAEMVKAYGAERAKKIRLRLDDLRAAAEMADLLRMGGKWEALKADRQGEWSGRLTANWRIIVTPVAGAIAAATVLVIEIEDYHKR